MAGIPAPKRPLALVTGASGGIGLDVADELGARGHDLVLVARSEAKLNDEAKRLAAAHRVDAHAIALDLCATDAGSKLAESLAERRLDVDVLVNNAGFGTFGAFVQTDLDEQVRMIQLNVLALTDLTRRLVPPMVARRRGWVMNVASTAAFQPGPYMAVYFATKAYVLSFSEALASELEGTGVVVSALCPGATATGFQATARTAGSGLTEGRELPPSRPVAKRGVDGLFAGERVVIPGAQNWLMAQSPRFAPRNLVTAIAKKMVGPKR